MGYFSSMYILIPGVILAMLANILVNNAYRKYSRVSGRSGMTGAQVARMMLDRNGLYDVQIEVIPGELSDHYDPRHRVMRLSQGVANSTSIAAMGVAAHECGHAIQDGVNYIPLKFRGIIYPVCNLGSNAAWPLFFIGLFLGGSRSTFGMVIMEIGIILFMVAILFYIVTLPVEFNASRRAIKNLKEYNVIAQDEIAGVRKVLSAAALTYVASALMAILNLVRMVMLRERN